MGEKGWKTQEAEEGERKWKVTPRLGLEQLTSLLLRQLGGKGGGMNGASAEKAAYSSETAGKNWYVSYYDLNGKQHTESSGTARNRKRRRCLTSRLEAAVMVKYNGRSSQTSLRKMFARFWWLTTCIR